MSITYNEEYISKKVKDWISQFITLAEMSITQAQRAMRLLLAVYGISGLNF